MEKGVGDDPITHRLLRFLHRSRLTLCIFHLVLLYVAVIPAESAPPPRFGGMLRLAVFQPVTTVDAVHYLNFSELQVASNLYEGLVKRDGFGRVISAVAQSWTHSDDYRTWTFTIARDAKFHNGKPVTATDVKQAWERSIRDGNWFVPPFPLNLIEGADGRAEQVNGIRAVDVFHLQVKLKSSQPEFLVKLTSPTAWITMPGHPQPVGTGRFRMASYRATEIRLTANLDYVWGRPYLDELNFQYYTDVREALFDFESGVLDILPLPLTETERHRREHLDDSLIQTDAAAVVYLRIGQKTPASPAWGDLLRYAIDVGTLLQLQYGAEPSQMGLTAFPLPYDRVKARRRLKHTGWDTSQTLSLIYAPLPDSTGHAIANRLQRDFLSPIGLQIAVKTTNFVEFQEALQDASADLALLSMPISQEGGLSALEHDPRGFLIPLYLMPASFLCQPKVHGVNIVWGGVIAFENAWLMD